MSTEMFRGLLQDSLEDGRLDRKEKAALRNAFLELTPTPRVIAFLRHLVFAEAKRALLQLEPHRRVVPICHSSRVVCSNLALSVRVGI